MGRCGGTKSCVVSFVPLAVRRCVLPQCWRVVGGLTLNDEGSMKSKSIQNLSVSAAVAAILSGVALAGYTPVSHAQEAAEGGGELQEITVTGSRIVRKDLQSNSPLVTVDTEVFEAKTG